MSRRWTHNRLLFTKLRLLKNLKKTLGMIQDFELSMCLANNHKDIVTLIMLKGSDHGSYNFKKSLNLAKSLKST